MNNPTVSPPPIFVGRYRTGETSHFLPLSQREMDRSVAFFSRILASFRFQYRDHVLTIATPDEAAQYAPFEKAAAARGLILMNADHSPYEGHRMEAILRRFRVVAVMGLSGWILDGALGLGHSIDAMFTGRVVWARPCAFPKIAHTPAARVLRCAEFGPAFAAECAAGAGMHLDNQEWAAETADDGEILITSRLPRLAPANLLATGIYGRVDTHPCVCGNGDVRIVLKDSA